MALHGIAVKPPTDTPVVKKADTLALKKWKPKGAGGRAATRADRLYGKKVTKP